ncbi:Arrestin-related trafficking adapter 3 [Fusarium mundagurra]|uniref:Arrestin-related trafficking adapter 3 n=1 Tax=Fusarium mundagurra TaxID=1567541 RepID=A0A8H5YU96_9HYPO|nr:Arrestin-related trafficking adapter 3 [Fusarium mundagurra]
MPVTLGNRATCSIHLDEPSLFLTGFESLCHGCHQEHNGTTLLRGTLQLHVSRNTKIKSVQLKLVGRTRLHWQQETQSDFNEESNLPTQVSTFFSALNNLEKNDFGFQCRYQLQSASGSDSNLINEGHTLAPLDLNLHSIMGAKKRRRLSLDNVQAQFYNHGNTIRPATEVQDYKIFYPGSYDYPFAFSIAQDELETIKVPYGSVKWELRASIARPGMFNTNLCGRKEVTLVRIPDPLSLETMQSVLFSRQWEDCLYYDISLGGTSFPIGSMIPIFLRLRPLDKVQVHGFEVLVIESIEYSSNDKKVTKKPPSRTVLLLKKTAKKAIFPSWATSGLVIVRDGEFTPEPRNETCEMAAEQRIVEASGERTSAVSVTERRDSLLINSDPDLPTFWGTTEIEAAVQIPTCALAEGEFDGILLPRPIHADIDEQVILHVSRLDANSPNGERRIYRDTTTHLPLALLDCRANQGNMSLPSYSYETSPSLSHYKSCGCPDALTIPIEKPPCHSVEGLAACHLVGDGHNTHTTTYSWQPTEESADHTFDLSSSDNDITPPSVPALITDELPPHYDDIVGGTGLNGLEDYFSHPTHYG